MQYCWSGITHCPRPSSPTNLRDLWLTGAQLNKGCHFSCSRFHTVKAGETCSVLEARYGLPAAYFETMNCLANCAVALKAGDEACVMPAAAEKGMHFASEAEASITAPSFIAICL